MDLKSGHGRLVEGDGETYSYEGEWLNGVKHGKGKEFLISKCIEQVTDKSTVFEFTLLLGVTVEYEENFEGDFANSFKVLNL